MPQFSRAWRAHPDLFNRLGQNLAIKDPGVPVFGVDATIKGDAVAIMVDQILLVEGNPLAGMITYQFQMHRFVRSDFLDRSWPAAVPEDSGRRLH